MKITIRALTIVTAIVFVFSLPVQAWNGGTLYKAKCTACHGADGKGDIPVGKKIGVRDFALPEVHKETDPELIEIITNGKNKMPAYGKGLKDTQIKDLVAYVRELGNKKK
jgi:cytochrome c6